MSPPRRERKSSLVLRIYLIGLAQFFAVAFGVEMNRRANRPPPWTPRDVNFVADTLAVVSDDRVALQREVDRAQRSLQWWVSVRDSEGRVMAETQAPAPPLNLDPPAARGNVPFTLKNGTTGHFAYIVQPRTPPPGPGFVVPVVLVLCVVGIASWATARSLTKPLATLSGAARAFGSGQLDARVKMSRSDELGEMAGAFNDMADRITRLLLAERELLANISHELRTPLARIRVALDIANESEREQAFETLKDITEDLAELERIVDDVLAAARLALEDETQRASASLPLRREPLHLGTLLEKAEQKFRSLHPKRPFESIVEDDMPEVLGDAVLMRRVIDNLLDNAHKYTPQPDAPITLSAKSEPDGILIEVEDRGAGVAPEDLERLFEPFFRVDRSRTRATGGLGLGLALARRVVEAHGGTIWFTSEVGTRTVAHVRLPLAKNAVAT